MEGTKSSVIIMLPLLNEVFLLLLRIPVHTPTCKRETQYINVM